MLLIATNQHYITMVVFLCKTPFPIIIIHKNVTHEKIEITKQII